MYYDRVTKKVFSVVIQRVQDGYQNFNRLWAEGSKTFDGDESLYKLWEVKFLGYLRIQDLHQIILAPTDQNDDIDFVEKNATIFAELIQYLISLSLVMHETIEERP